MNIDTQAERDLFAGTTQGEWRLAEKGNSVPSIAITTTAYDGAPPVNICCGISPKRIDDAQFMARAHNSFPAWMDEIDKGREVREMAASVAQALLQSVSHNTGMAYVSQDLYADIKRLRKLAGEGGQDD